MGLTPRSVLEVPAGAANRLERLFTLLTSCGSSIHDLSRVELSPDPPRCPRFNLPFELGLASALTLAGYQHRWFVFESQPFRLQKSLSDINGFDPYIHDGTPEGVLRELGNAFVTNRSHPIAEELTVMYQHLKTFAKGFKVRNGLSGLFTPYAFQALVTTSQEVAVRLGIRGH